MIIDEQCIRNWMCHTGLEIKSADVTVAQTICYTNDTTSLIIPDIQDMFRFLQNHRAKKVYRD
jgi:hypothetical protein